MASVLNIATAPFRFFWEQIKVILSYQKKYLKEEFNWGLYIFTFVFLLASLFVNYFWMEKGTVDTWLTSQFKGQFIYILVLFAYYGIPYLIVLIAYSLFMKRYDHLKQWGFWATAAFAMLCLAVNLWFWYYQPLAKDLSISLGGQTHAYKWIRLCFWNLKSTFFYCIPLIIFWKLFDRERDDLYGFNKKKYNAKPYFTMLAIMLPIIIAVSFLPDFGRAYPQYKPGTAEPYLGVSNWFTVLIFELVYGFDFAFVELFFRGFLVIGLAKWLGKGAILPMVACYCFIHFGKPFGEALGSIFGGFILGVIAYYTRSIWGGVIAHLGVAWMMEIFGHMQLAFFSEQTPTVVLP